MIGGSLAAMLALTECHTSPQGRPPGSISALALGNPILNWTGLFETTQDPTAARIDSGRPTNEEDDRVLTIGNLLRTRDIFFNKVEACFDPFASPLLFFRTPSFELPNTAHHYFNGDEQTDAETESTSSEPIRKRRSLRKYPPASSNLLLPHTRIEVGSENVLRDQSIELVDLMRKSFRRTSDEAFIATGDAPDSEFELVQRENMGLWDENLTYKVGRWLGQMLRKP